MGKTLRKDLVKHRYLYLLLLPTVLFYVLFQYVPMYGVLLAFKEFRYHGGILGGPWVGLDNFKDLVGQSDFWRAFWNTLYISCGRLVFEFPVAILLALLINEVAREKMKKFYQTVYTFPHFISWVIISGIMFNFLGSAGVVNQIIASLGFHKVTFLTDPGLFRAIVFLSNIWKEVGWSAIIYLAAIAGINPELYEAAYVDGAGRFEQLKSVTWPSIRGTAAILLILAVGNAMNGGFDQIFNLYNPGVYSTGDIIDTYTYRSAFSDGLSFGVTTAVGLFKAVLNFSLLYLANFIVKRLGGEGLV
ncbi:ABC transporter permease [Paenibacillus sacheonensis]|uniref:ABC transporter permease subunit n=1 Tax=Paenibacillus sacheonensis TaxID=742054 RepID=A0A7X4YRY0_9BACL|nr:ABC transporter permease subunit [Paenibacillus sacheonensis]MBM7566211.1 putative aldouronate transport system permease protein [Paenibacillus sacheonensis]NBC70419.1 ABC transporter permease subunit [Paenibacillus sacheonensis]